MRHNKHAGIGCYTPVTGWEASGERLNNSLEEDIPQVNARASVVCLYVPGKINYQGSSMKISLLALCLLAALPCTAFAGEGLSYTYAEATYAETHDEGHSAQGWAVNGSYALHPNVNLFGDFTRQKTDFKDRSFQTWRVGVGYNHEIANDTDLVARVAYNSARPASPLIEFNGWSAEAGIRTAFTPHLEVFALGGYQDYLKNKGYNPDGRFYIDLGAQAKLNQRWSLSADMKMDRRGSKIWFVGPRLSW
mgnify:CR=1 FL=1